MGEVGVRPVQVLLVEDNAGDIRLIQETLKEAEVQIRLTVAKDGVLGMAALRQEGEFSGTGHVDLVLLDLNLPGKDGREVLADIRTDAALKNTPVIVLTSSAADKDVSHAYDHWANCYIVKPIDLDDFTAVVRSIEDFWLTIVKLPPNGADR